MMTASTDLFIANCNTIAVAARDLAADCVPSVPGAEDAMSKCGMCYSLIAETCDMLIALDAKNIDIGNCDFDPMICVATILTKGASAARAEA